MTRLHKNKEYFSNIDRTVDSVREEINAGLSLLSAIQKPIVTFFGSHRVTSDSLYYRHAEQLAYELGRVGYAIMSGGGPGIMHAANSGATRARAPSLGLQATLLTDERVLDPIFTQQLSFHFLFARRFIMSIKSEALIFYPGGYGTLNELFEYAVLMQTNIVDTVPLICVNKEYWSGLFEWTSHSVLERGFFIHDMRDFNLLHLTDDPSEILDIVRRPQGKS